MAEKEAYAQFCLDRAPLLMEIAQTIFRAAGVPESKRYDDSEGSPMTEGFDLGTLEGIVLLTYHKANVREEMQCLLTRRLATLVQTEAAYVGCAWPVHDFVGPDTPTVILGLPEDEQITVLYRHFVQ